MTCSIDCGLDGVGASIVILGQRWLAKAIRSIFPNADLSGPDVETNQPFKG